MTEFRGVTITDDHQRFLKENNINFSTFVQNSIDHARCKHVVKIRPDQQEWIESHHTNINLLLMDAIDVEMKNSGR